MNNLFLSKYINSLDKKLRVSVPSQYRTILSNQMDEDEEFKGIVAYRSIRNKSIEACSLKRIHKLYSMINELDPYSEERDAFETMIFGGSFQLAFDKEGRVSLPDELIEHAGFDSQICFVGKGEVFEMWNLEEFENYSKLATAKAVSNRNMLGARNI